MSTCEQYISTDDSRHDGEEVNFDVTQGAAAPPHDVSSAGFEPQFPPLQKVQTIQDIYRSKMK